MFTKEDCKGKKVAFCVSGSGAKGILEAGSLKALYDRGFEYDALYGASSGALNGSMLHSRGIEHVLNAWRTVKNSDITSWRPWYMFMKNKGSFYDNAPLKEYIQKNVDWAALVSNPKPFKISIASLDTWTPLIVQPDRAEQLWASASPLVEFPPVTLETPISGASEVTDGGILNDSLLAEAVKDGADVIFIITGTVPNPKKINNIINSTEVLISMLSYSQFLRDLEAIKVRNSVPGYRHIDAILIKPDKPLDIGLLDFDFGKQDRDSLLLEGYNFALRALNAYNGQ